MTTDEQEKELVRNLADRVRRNNGKPLEGLKPTDWLLGLADKWTSDTDTASDCWAIREAYTKEFTQ